MQEKWAVAYEACDMGRGTYLWLRDSCGEIVIFGSKWEAKQWVQAEISFGLETDMDGVIYIKLSHKDA